MILGWGLILLGWRWLNKTQPISDQPEGWDLHAVRGGIDSGDLCFPLRLVRDVDVWQDV